MRYGTPFGTLLGATALFLASAGCAIPGLSGDVEGKIRFVVVEASGGGWGASKLAREAIESLEVADTLFMSGARATFTVKSDARVTKRQVAAALRAKNMKLERFRREWRPRPEVCYVATVTGLGWVQKAKRVRAALIRMDGVIDAFVNQEIALQLTRTARLDERRLAEILAQEGVEVQEVARSERYVL